MANTHKVVVDVPNTAKGEKVEVLYLGLFENGATHELTDEQVTTYEAVTGNKFPESGYIFAGEPKGKVQEEAYAKNEKAEVSTVSKGFEPQGQNPTQIEGGTTSSFDSVETTETGEDK